MAKAIRPDQLPAYLLDRQKKQPTTIFAASLGLTRQAYNKLCRSETAPSRETLDRIGLEAVLRVHEAGIILTIAKLGGYLRKEQGKKPDTLRAAELGLSRQHYRWIATGEIIPRTETLKKLKMELLYRVKRA